MLCVMETKWPLTVSGSSPWLLWPSHGCERTAGAAVTMLMFLTGVRSKREGGTEPSMVCLQLVTDFCKDDCRQLPWAHAVFLQETGSFPQVRASPMICFFWNYLFICAWYVYACLQCVGVHVHTHWASPLVAVHVNY